MLDHLGMGHSAVGTDFQESKGCWDNMQSGPLVFGTKCNWDFWSLGQNVIGTFGLWDNLPFFGTHMHWDKRYWDKMILGQFTYCLHIIGTIHLRLTCHWDKRLNGHFSE